MRMREIDIQDYARQLLEAHGDRAVAEAAQKACAFEQQGNKSAYAIPPYGYLEEEQRAATCMYVKCTAVRFALHVPVGDTKAHLTAKYVSVKNR